MPKSECVDVGRPLPVPLILPVEYDVPVGAWLVVVFLLLAADMNSSYCVPDLGLMANTMPDSHSLFWRLKKNSGFLAFVTGKSTNVVMFFAKMGLNPESYTPFITQGAVTSQEVTV